MTQNGTYCFFAIKADERFPVNQKMVRPDASFRLSALTGHQIAHSFYCATVAIREEISLRQAWHKVGQKNSKTVSLGAPFLFIALRTSR